MKKIFLTGATGFLGAHILKELCLLNNVKIIVLIRGKTQSEAETRIKDSLVNSFGQNFFKKNFRNLNVIRGDITKENFNIRSNFYNNLITQIAEIFHCAASTDFRMNLATARIANCFGTENILKLADRSKNLNKFHYISTAFVAGTKEGLFAESDFDVHQRFNNAYEQSKFEAELLVRDFIKKRLKIHIYRPSIIMGEYYTGKTTSFKMFYQPLHYFFQELYTAAPIDPGSPYNFIPVDTAAKAIISLSNLDLNNDLVVFHIVSNNNISLGHIIDLLCGFLSIRKPRYVSVAEFNKLEKSVVKKKLIEPFIPYFNFKALFDNTKTNEFLSKAGFLPPVINDGYIYRILNFCLKVNFLKKY